MFVIAFWDARGNLTEDTDYIKYNDRIVITIRTTERNGNVIGMKHVTDDDEVMMITNYGKIIRIKMKEVSVIGRNTQGVRLIGVEKDELIARGQEILSENKLDIAESRYNDGQISRRAYLDSRIFYLDARNSYLEELRNYLMDRLDLEGKFLEV